MPPSEPPSCPLNAYKINNRSCGAEGLSKRACAVRPVNVRCAIEAANHRDDGQQVHLQTIFAEEAVAVFAVETRRRQRLLAPVAALGLALAQNLGVVLDHLGFFLPAYR